MKVVCDNCRAVYKVPDEKLTKAVNKATCRNCGHRMLIPRPKPNADPDERTLVTAVPPTPVGAPPRSIRDDSRSGPDDLRVGTPMVSSRTDQTVSQPDDDFDDAPDTKLSISPSEQNTAKPEPSRMPRSAPPPGRSTTSSGMDRRGPEPSRSGTPSGAKLPPARSSDSLAGISPHREASGPAALPGPGIPRDGSSVTPPPGRRSASTSGAHPRAATPPPASARGPRSGVYPATALHDPASDLNWALLGTSTALIGGFLLAFLSVWNSPLVMWFGLAMTFGGGLLSFMVLLTGARGRRPARTFLSVVLGFLFAMVISTTLVATKWSAERLIDAYDIHFSNVAMGTATPSPPLEAIKAPSVGAVASVADPLPGQGDVAAPTPEAAREPARTPPAPAPAVREPARPEPARPEPARPEPVREPARPEPARTPPPAPAARTAPPAPAPAPIPDPVPVPAPAPAMQNVPMDVIHIMLSNNLEVKKCFVPLLKAGSLPSRVDLKFNILPSGTATNAQVINAQFRGTDFEGCLARAVSAMTFPQTSGSGTSITYPFVLQ